MDCRRIKIDVPIVSMTKTNFLKNIFFQKLWRTQPLNRLINFYLIGNLYDKSSNKINHFFVCFYY